mgnify:CR=1 FL=1
MNACEMNTNAQKIIDDAMQLEARVRALVAETRMESLGLIAAFQVIEQRDHGQEIRDQADDEVRIVFERPSSEVQAVQAHRHTVGSRIAGLGSVRT